MHTGNQPSRMRINRRVSTITHLARFLLESEPDRRIRNQFCATTPSDPGSMGMGQQFRALKKIIGVALGRSGSLLEGPKLLPHSMERQLGLEILSPALAGRWDDAQSPGGVRQTSKIFDLCGCLIRKRFVFFKSLRCREGIGLSFLEPKNWLLDCHFSCSLRRAESRLRLRPKT